MDFYQDERLALFIDGSNLYATAKELGFDWFLGNTLMNNRAMGVQGGSAPSPTTRQDRLLW